MDMTTAMDAVRQWPAADQIEFVQQIWDQLVDSGWSPELTDAQKRELDRRIVAHESDPSNVYTWEEVEARLGQKE
jgi:putative addiction module component (TIGR02574 family)